MSATVAVVPAPRPIVVLLPAVVTVVPALKVIVLPLIVSVWPLSAVRMLEARGVPTGSGLAAKSDGFRPPSASSVPLAAVVLAEVFGWVGRFAAYWIEVV